MSDKLHPPKVGEHRYRPQNSRPEGSPILDLKLTRESLEAMGAAFNNPNETVYLTYKWFKELREMAIRSIEQDAAIERLEACNLTLRRVIGGKREAGNAQLAHEFSENEKLLNRFRSVPVPPKYKGVA